MFIINKEMPLVNLKNGVTRKVLAYSHPMMSVEFHYESGSICAMHKHFHEQIGYVVYGSVIFMEEGKEDKTLVAGDSYHIQSGVSHGVIAVEETMLLDLFTPMRDDFVMNCE